MIVDLYNYFVLGLEKSDVEFWGLTPRTILHRFWYNEYMKNQKKEPVKGNEAINILKGLMQR